MDSQQIRALVSQNLSFLPLQSLNNSLDFAELEFSHCTVSIDSCEDA